MRSGTVHIQEGYDGEYGRIQVFKEGEIELLSQESFLFNTELDSPEKEAVVPSRGFFNFDIGAYRRLRGLSMEEQASIFAQKTKPSDKSSDKPSDKRSNVLMEFNEEQRNAVMHTQGPALVLAGPGTGKTRVLAGRIAHLLQSGVDAGTILAVTFSNRAAEEMRRRVSVMLEDEMLIRNLHISTFHAFGLRVLKGNAETFGRTEEFVILDDRERSYILATLSDGEYDDKKIRSMISKEKRGDGGGQDDILNRYEEALMFHNAFDYDDLIYKPLVLLKNSPELLQEYRGRYTHILIDEYQDINSSQYQLIRLLKPGTDSEIFAIGDPDQAIYGFRGADAGFINSFYNDYPGAATYSLSRSYRCSSYILKASQGVIGRSEHKPGFLKGLLGGVKVRITELSSDRSEAEFVARSIERMMGGLRFFSMDSDISEGSTEMDIQSLSDFVILCRLKEQMGHVVEALMNHSIPHQLVGTTPFYRDEPFSSVIDLFRLSIMPEHSLLRNRMVKKGILHEDEDLKHRWEGQSVLEAAMGCLTQVLRIEKPESSVHFNHFVELCRKYGKDMQAFLHSVDLGSGTDTYREGLEQVTVMTIHAAKGLEFPTVFVIGCEDGLLPFTLLPNFRSDMDEERRLLYVAMTRARKFLILSHARKRYMFGKSLALGRSRFLDTVEEELLDVSQAGFRAKHNASHDQLELF
jgi:superfamily I DNA/RNA helicase